MDDNSSLQSSGTGGSQAGEAMYEQRVALRSAHRGLPTVKPERTPAAVLSRESENTDIHSTSLD